MNNEQQLRNDNKTLLRAINWVEQEKRRSQELRNEARRARDRCVTISQGEVVQLTQDVQIRGFNSHARYHNAGTTSCCDGQKDIEEGVMICWKLKTIPIVVTKSVVAF